MIVVVLLVNIVAWTLWNHASSERIDRITVAVLKGTCASHLPHPGCIKNADWCAGTGVGTTFAMRRA